MRHASFSTATSTVPSPPGGSSSNADCAPGRLSTAWKISVRGSAASGADNRTRSRRAAWKGPDEPEWFYALDEVAYQGLTSNIHVPILALAELSRSTRSFLHMPEAVVHRSGHEDIEVDIWAIVDGRIVIGEAKKSDRLESSDRREKQRCAALRVLVADLTADEFVMATAAPAWSERSKNNVERTIGSTTAVRWLTDLR